MVKHEALSLEEMRREFGFRQRLLPYLDAVDMTDEELHKALGISKKTRENILQLSERCERRIAELEKEINNRQSLRDVGKENKMATYYKVYITDDHLGMMIGPEGKSLNVSEEAKLVQRKLEEQDAPISHPFECYGELDMIYGELRNCHPSNYMEVFARYDHVYYRDDSRGSELINLKMESLRAT
jgi:hypothetical protein